MSTRKKTPAKAAGITELSAGEPALEARAAAATQLERARADTSDRETWHLSARTFAVSGGRMSTVLPPAEYRATKMQIADGFPWLVDANSPILCTPLGFHLDSSAGATPMSFDPVSAWRATALTVPSSYIVAPNGFGKGTHPRRWPSFLSS